MLKVQRLWVIQYAGFKGLQDVRYAREMAAIVYGVY